MTLAVLNGQIASPVEGTVTSLGAANSPDNVFFVNEADGSAWPDDNMWNEFVSRAITEPIAPYGLLGSRRSNKQRCRSIISMGWVPQIEALCLGLYIKQHCSASTQLLLLAIASSIKIKICVDTKASATAAATTCRSTSTILTLLAMRIVIRA
jgi:hypothetical protein